jgi:hypothetical protein
MVQIKAVDESIMKSNIFGTPVLVAAAVLSVHRKASFRYP